MEFEKILTKLGGINTSIRDEENLTDLGQLENFDMNHNFMQFVLKYSPFQFKENVVIKNTNKKLLHLMKEKTLNVDIFYSMSKNSSYSVFKELEMLNNQIPKGFFPFCSDGFSGDLFCIGIDNKNYGKIFYFWHEAPNDRFFKICDSFEAFLESLINFDLPDDSDVYEEEDNTPLSETLLKDILEWKKNK